MMNESGPKRLLIITKAMTLADVADQLGYPANEIILYLLRQGIVYNKNKVLPENLIKELARHYGVGFEIKQQESLAQEKEIVKTEEGVVQNKRAPVVVVVGHVDHGKTTLLDYIRKTRVAQREKGGITQHLGAYKVATKHGDIVFLDTPGHEAFTFMRARGVKVADIAILVVAADDGVMPQTVEAIKHAQNAKVPIIVALNKIDKAEPKRIEEVKNQLSRQGLVVEDWGGDVTCIPLSAKTGVGVDKLLETLPVFAELLELKARTTGPGIGSILESKMEKGRGSVATVILQQGVLRVGDFVQVGAVVGRISAMVDTTGSLVQEVGPSMPVQIAGLDSLPQAGDALRVIALDEYKKLRSGAEKPKSGEAVVQPNEDALQILLKVDTNSSKEALEISIAKLAKQEQQEINIILSSVGAITESDVQFAATAHAAIYGFCVKPESHVQSLAKKMGVTIKTFFVIYHLLDDLKEIIQSMRKPQMVEKKIGEAIVRKVFNIKGMVIAGCYVKTGKITKGCKAVVWHDGQKTGEGIIQTLQREKRAVKEVSSGFECGFIIDGFGDYNEEDRVEFFIEEMVLVK